MTGRNTNPRRTGPWAGLLNTTQDTAFAAVDAAATPRAASNPDRPGRRADWSTLDGAR